MASTFFSDHFSTDGDNALTLASPAKIIQAGLNSARIRYKRGKITGMPLTTDHVRFFSMKSSDRLLALYISSDGGSTAGAVDVGLHLAGDNHDGVVVDKDLFASATTVSGDIHRTVLTDESGTLTGLSAGGPLWLMAADGAGIDTVDPKVIYDVTATPSTSLSDADSILTLEAFYIAGEV